MMVFSYISERSNQEHATVSKWHSKFFFFRAKWHHEAGTEMSNTQNIRQMRMQFQKISNRWRYYLVIYVECDKFWIIMNDSLMFFLQNEIFGKIQNNLFSLFNHFCWSKFKEAFILSYQVRSFTLLCHITIYYPIVNPKSWRLIYLFHRNNVLNQHQI